MPAARTTLVARLPQLALGLVAAAALIWLALQQGAYDVVPRQTAGLALWWLVGVGAVVVRRPALPGAAGIVVTLLAAGIAVWSALGLAGSISQERTGVEIARAVAHLGPLVLIGWVLPRRAWPAVFGGLVVGAVAVVGIALAERLSPGLIAAQPTVVFEQTLRRLGEPLGYWNAVGSWSVMTAALLVAVSSHARWSAVRALALAVVPVAVAVGYLTYSRSAIGAAALAALLLFVLSAHRWTTTLHLLAAIAGGGAAIVAVRGAPAIANATGGEGAGGVLTVLAIAGVVLALVALLTARLGVDRLRLPERAARLSGGVAVLVAAITLFVAVDQYGTQAWNDFKDPVEATAEDPTERLASLKGTRYLQWDAALDAWREDRWRGSGAGTFELTWNPRATNAEFIRDAHNSFIETLSEQGIPGLALLLGFWLSLAATIIVAARRAATAAQRGIVAGVGAALGAFMLGTGIDWFWELTALAMLAMALAGVAIAASRPGREPAAAEGPRDQDATAVRAAPSRATPRPRAALALRGGLLVLAIVGVLTQLPGLVGVSEIRRSEQALAAGDYAAARDHADQAAEILPWASSPFLQRALVDEAAGELRSARQALHLAIERDPHDWRLPLVLARVEARAGRVDAALEAYRRAKALRPNGKFFG